MVLARRRVTGVHREPEEALVNVGEVAAAVYAHGGRLVALENGQIGIEGDLPKDLRKHVRKRVHELYQAVYGDLMSGPGWEVTVALEKQAVAYLYTLIEKRFAAEGPLALSAARERAMAALCRSTNIDRLNAAWVDGTFEEFRTALKEYVGAGWKAANAVAGEKKKLKMEVRA
jgi:hypothetical protein